jgi:hypothetical protein
MTQFEPAIWIADDALGETPQSRVMDWRRELAGDEQARARWHDLDGGNWSWEPGGLHLRPGSVEWYSLVLNRDTFPPWRNAVIEVTVQGTAKGAGIGFGPFRDFLAEATSQPKHLQLEMDAAAGRWRFRVDGQFVAPSWLNSAVTRVDDIVSGAFAMKACQPEHVVFRDLAIHDFRESCKISVIIVCNRFLQRLRLALRNWCHQDAPLGAYEVLVVNPDSPDGTREHIRAVARSYPDVRVCEIAAPATLATNKGALINHAVGLAHGEWIWLTDADCLFPASAIGCALAHVQSRGDDRLFYGRRLHLTDSVTSALLAGRVDGVAGYAALAALAPDAPVENAPWGYTQIVSRAVLDGLRYTETFDHFAHSDGEFAERCKRRGLPPEQVPGLCCLHLEHPFAWYGNSAFL